MAPDRWSRTWRPAGDAWRCVGRGTARVAREGLVLAIRLYQALVSPLLGPRCRFYPSCSTYGADAIRRHGCVKGLWLGLVRVCRCHPLHPGGVDLVPE